MKILVTGGAGYVGSHVVRALAEGGFDPVSLDNLSEGHSEAVTAGELVVGDLENESLLRRLFDENQFAAVMHFASRCYVGESVTNPLWYYQQNVAGALPLLQVMREAEVSAFILSSSCAVYGNPKTLPLREDHPTHPVNPYGDTKLTLEKILRACDTAHGLRSVCLRYFNAAGASLDGRIGESHSPETHLLPLVLKAAKGEVPAIEVYGDDYPTPDGTAIRDYIHVEDLADAHLRALGWLLEGRESQAFNLGTGTGSSVRQAIETAQEVSGKSVPAKIVARRPGDPPELVADPGKALEILGWSAKHSDLRTILASAWNWESNRSY